jgi:hypothetical protein
VASDSVQISSSASASGDAAHGFNGVDDQVQDHLLHWTDRREKRQALTSILQRIDLAP